MENNPEIALKIKNFLTDVCDFAEGNLPFTHLDNYVNQAVIYYTIDKLDTQIETLESIKHILTKDQIRDVNKIIKQYVSMKAKLYEQF